LGAREGWQKFSKVGSLINLQGKITEKLAFEKFYLSWAQGKDVVPKRPSVALPNMPWRRLGPVGVSVWVGVSCNTLQCSIMWCVSVQCVVVQYVAV